MIDERNKLFYGEDVKADNTRLSGGLSLTDIDELREMIENIDREIVELIATRMEVADELGKEKNRLEKGHRDPDVESKVVERYLALSKEVDISEEDARKIASTILEISLERQKKLFR